MRRKLPHAGAVLARLWRRSTPACAASRGSIVCSPNTQPTRLRAFTGTVTAGISSPHGPPPVAAVSRLTKAVKRNAGAAASSAGEQLARVDLHSSGLARHQVDEVEADVRLALAQGRDRLAARSRRAEFALASPAVPAAEIDVVVPVYGNYELTRACLESLAGQTASHRVIVVDDGSPDDSAERVRSDWPQATLLELGSRTTATRRPSTAGSPRAAGATWCC